MWIFAPIITVVAVFAAIIVLPDPTPDTSKTACEKHLPRTERCVQIWVPESYVRKMT